MIIKLLKYKDIVQLSKAGKEMEMTQIVGQKMDGTEYTKNFFSNNSTLANQLAGFGAGDYLRLDYDDSKFKNLESIIEATADEVEKAKQYAKGRKEWSKPGKKDYKKSDGTSRGDDTNRSASIYLAAQLIAKDAPWEGYNLYVKADEVFAYITKGTKPPLEYSDTDDGQFVPIPNDDLDPPDID
jgi:hypothetical protein